MSEQLEYDDRMSDADSLMWIIERNPMLRSTITAVAVLESTPDRDQLQWRVDRASRLVPRLRQRVVANPMSIAPPRWEVDRCFNLAYHLRWTSLGGSGTVRDLLDLAEPIAMQGFDRARPLWEFTVVEGLEDGAAALIMKVHHAITDGIGAVKMMLETFSLDDGILDRDELPPEPIAHVMSQKDRVADAVHHEAKKGLTEFTKAARTLLSGDLGEPADIARELGSTAASAGRLLQPASEPLSTVMTDRSLGMHFDTLTLSLADMKAAAHHADAKMNTAFVTGACRGMSYYHDAHELPVEELRMGMPINQRSPDSANQTGNQFTPARFVVPVDIEDPVEHMTAIRNLTSQAQAEPANSIVEPMAGVLRRLPKLITTNVFSLMLTGVDFMTSNVPGVPVPIYLEGAPVKAQFAFGPLSGAAINMTLLSYVDDLHIGINIDTAAVPDPELLIESLQRGFDDILALA